MIAIGKLIKSSVALNQRYQKVKGYRVSQRDTLISLLKKARKTKFGKHYDFDAILKADDIEKAFRESIPVYDYNSIYKAWWKDTFEGEENVCWPGKVKYFALSSGTSGSPSKTIPVTGDMIASIRKAGFWHLSSLQQTNIKDDIYKRQILLIGGSTQLDRVKRSYQGDLSGIMTANLPMWLSFLYKPGRVISREKNWNEKIKKITEKAKDWDVGIISGVPSWIQLLFENIIAHYQLETIHDIWPNLQVYSHGGVSIKPYERSFKKLLGRDILFLETYLASEGFIAFENLSGTGMELVQNNGVYYEFIPFNDTNFSADGELLSTEGTVGNDGVENGKEYAILLSTCSGTWRYLIGDTVKFSDGKIAITGRTKHFLSLCGEHLSVDNMNEALKQTATHFQTDIREFTVVGEKIDGGFAHHWYLGAENENVLKDEGKVAEILDKNLKELNDDYKTERGSVLKEVHVHTVPCKLFYRWMESQSRIGGQSKFPRVLNEKQLVSWKEFLAQRVSI